MNRPEDNHIALMNAVLGVEDLRSPLDRLAEEQGARTRAERRAFKSEFLKEMRRQKKKKENTAG